MKITEKLKKNYYIDWYIIISKRINKYVKIRRNKYW